jgi:hypothetical protein
MEEDQCDSSEGGIHDLLDDEHHITVSHDIELKKTYSDKNQNNEQTDSFKYALKKRSIVRNRSSFTLPKVKMGSFSRLKTNSSFNLLSKSMSVSSLNSKQYQDEELLVIYYISIVIRLLKLSDGLKAINEYKKKPGLSKRAQAHLAKLQGVLTILSEKKEYNEAKKHFDNAYNLFYKINSANGKAICRLALVRAQ